MDTFMTLLQSYVPHPETQRLVLMGLAGLTVFLFALGVSSLVTVAIDPKRRRLDALTPSSENDNDRTALRLGSTAPRATCVPRREPSATRFSNSSRMPGCDRRTPWLSSTASRPA